ncbi:hypothetical protein BC629DRAFT_1112591 [Irpex lacteus]|nr:hypothetical protein BC629DRAFT_1112591 [Irpex lacteus]
MNSKWRVDALRVGLVAGRSFVRCCIPVFLFLYFLCCFASPSFAGSRTTHPVLSHHMPRIHCQLNSNHRATLHRRTTSPRRPIDHRPFPAQCPPRRPPRSTRSFAAPYLNRPPHTHIVFLLNHNTIIVTSIPHGPWKYSALPSIQAECTDHPSNVPLRPFTNMYLLCTMICKHLHVVRSGMAHACRCTYVVSAESTSQESVCEFTCSSTYVLERGTSCQISSSSNPHTSTHPPQLRTNVRIVLNS